MRKFLMAMVGLGLSSGVAWGQGATQNIALEATVGGYCTINGSAMGGELGNNAIATANAKPTVATYTFSINNVQCTSSLKVQLTSSNGGLLNSGGVGQVTTSFVNKFHYSATARIGSGATGETLATVDTSTTGSPTAVAAVVGLYGSPTNAQTLSNATVAVDVTVQNLSSASNFLVNGTYIDTLVVTLTPNV